MRYLEKLQDARWLRRRWEILERDGRLCQKCGFNGGIRFRDSLHQVCDLSQWLEVHHIFYANGLEPWDYPGKALITLCNACHENETRLPTIFSELSKLDSDSLWRIRVTEIVNSIR